MPRPFRDLNGSYHVRVRVPKDLRALLGKGVEKRSLGTKDPHVAKRRYPDVLAEIQGRWANLRSETTSLTERDAHALAHTIYENWRAMHRDNPSQQCTWHTRLYDALWTDQTPDPELEPGAVGALSFDTFLIRGMRKFCFQQAKFGLAEHGVRVDQESLAKLAKAVAAAFQRASVVLEREAHGIFAPEEAPEPFRWAARGVAAPNRQARQSGSSEDSILALFNAWWEEARAAGRKPSTHESYSNTIESFVDFLGHDKPSRVTAQDVVAYKDHRLSTPSRRTGRVPSPKTIKDSDLAALKAVFGWAVANGKIPSNPAQGVTIKLGTPRKVRSKGFSDDEARAILAAALNYVPGGGERPCTALAKRWVPWLCAFTGARVGEIAQLRRQDVRREGDNWVIHITPDAGTVKTNQARDVVLHPQLVELGFPEFVQGRPNGPLFLNPAPTGDVLGPLQALKNRLAEFARSIVPDPDVKPNHGWRHRFKTLGMQAGIDSRTLDAIQGHAGRSVGDAYGDVTVLTMAAAISRLPAFELGN
jgi:integrase